jgi:hypothetical protein
VESSAGAVREGETVSFDLVDTCVFDGENWDVIGDPRPELDAAALGIAPRVAAASGKRTVGCGFAVEERQLALVALDVDLRRSDADRVADSGRPAIGGALPMVEGTRARWNGFRLPLSFTGEMRIGRSVAHALFEAATENAGWRYEEVRLLVFRRGALVDEVSENERWAEERERVLEEARSRLSETSEPPPKNGHWVETGLLGNKRREGELVDGKEEGPWSFWSEEGWLVREATFVAGVRHGPFRRFHRNGEVETIGTYERGQMHGLWRWFDEDGRLGEAMTYEMGEPEED